MNPLAWIGRQRGNAMASLLVIAVLTPPLGAILRPYLTEAIIGLLSVAFMRLDIATFGQHIRQPALIIKAALWTMLIVPALITSICWLVGVHSMSPGLYTALVLQAAASPMMAAPAIAMLLGLDASLTLATLILSTAAIPLTAPIFAALTGVTVSITALDLGIKLFAIVAGSALIGLLIRHLAGPIKLARYTDHLDGVNIVFLFVFVSAVLGDVGIKFLQAPVLILGLIATTFAMFFLLFALTYWVFKRAGQQSGVALALMATQRNAGLMLAATGGAVPEVTWLYFAVSQIPIYLTPKLMAPIVRRLAPGSAFSNHR
ncbi:MAG: hypothetical protein AB8C46_25490 [Burkholderiaceae bacterium]